MVMTLNAVSLLFATLVINIKKKGDRALCPEVPRLLMLFCRRFLAKITCTKMLTYYDLYDSCGDLRMPQVKENTDGEAEEENGNSKVKRRSLGQNKIVQTGITGRWLTADERRALAEKEPRELRLEWYFVAQVIDKALFIVFVTASALTVAFTLIIIPAMHAND